MTAPIKLETLADEGGQHLLQFAKQLERQITTVAHPQIGG